MPAMQQSTDQFLFCNLVNIINSLCNCLAAFFFLAYVLGQMQHEAAIPQLVEVCSSIYKVNRIVNFQY